MNNGRHNNGIYRNLNRRQQTVRKRRKNRLTIVLILVVALCLIWVTAFFLLSRLWGEEKPPSDTTDENSGMTTTEDSDSDSDPAQTGPADILVNSDFPYTFPANPESGFKPIYGNKTNRYKVSNSTLSLRADIIDRLNTLFDDFYDYSGKTDIQIYYGFRSYSVQEALFNSEVAKKGEVEAPNHVALPGNSEHHIGTAFDLNILSNEDGKTYTFEDKPEYSWVLENMHKYGFIHRYPENKIGDTGVSYEPWHFRYIGVPHSHLMLDKGYCLEEYIAYLRNFTFAGDHVKVEAGESRYEIYYVPCAEGENVSTDVPVPENLPYTVSGNNVDGFIVTITLK